LCQTVYEKKFLWAYLSLAKGRNFPMLLPQVCVNIAERRRPDFLVFVPLQYLKFKRYAIELDGNHSDEQKEADSIRDTALAGEDYEVISLRPNELGYYKEVQRLLEKIYEEMMEAEKSAWDLATEVEIASTTGGPGTITDEDIPF
jgi:hypothetical protein